MSLLQQLQEYVRACFTSIWVESHEHDDALAEIAALCRQEDWRLVVWDVDRGLSASCAFQGGLGFQNCERGFQYRVGVE